MATMNATPCCQKEQKLLSLITLAEAASRWSDMRMYTWDLIHLETLSTKDPGRIINFLSVCYKALSDGLRTALRELRYEKESRSTDAAYNQIEIEWKQEYESRLCEELSTLCSELFEALDLVHIDAASLPIELTIFQKKLHADFVRYSLECFKDMSDDGSDIEYQNRRSQSKQLYRDALHAAKTLSFHHPLRQTIIMNYSVFLFERCDDVNAAIAVCQQYLEETAVHVKEFSQDQQILHKKNCQNLSYWMQLQKEATTDDCS